MLLCQYSPIDMDFTHSEKTRAQISRLEEFMKTHIYPNEVAYSASSTPRSPTAGRRRP